MAINCNWTGYDNNPKASIFGYPLDLNRKINENLDHFYMFGMSGVIDSVKDGIMKHKIYTDGGMSGSPIMIERKGEW